MTASASEILLKQPPKMLAFLLKGPRGQDWTRCRSSSISGNRAPEREHEPRLEFGHMPCLGLIQVKSRPCTFWNTADVEVD